MGRRTMAMIAMGWALTGCGDGSSSVAAPPDAAVTDLGADVTADLGADVTADLGADLGADVTADLGTDATADLGMDVAVDVNTVPPCVGGTTRCGARCASLQSDNDHCGACGNACPAGTSCSMGVCGCRGTLRNCSGDAGARCVDLEADNNHCGTCGNACPAGQRCVGARCEASCGAGQTLCEGRCVDTRNDPAQCGTCGRACAASPNRPAVCIAGVCRQGECDEGFADCDNGPANGCEAELARNPAHCGRCGNRCPAGRFGTVGCVAGSCVASCNAGYADCDRDATNGCEVDTNNDPRNCGGCNVACPAGQGCQQGTCRAGGPCSVLASILCVAWGGAVAETSPGSGRIVCTRNGRSSTDFCSASCDNYRIYAWRAGARPSVCASQTADTVAGTIYTGPAFCGCDQPLRACGSWDLSTCVAD